MVVTFVANEIKTIVTGNESNHSNNWITITVTTEGERYFLSLPLLLNKSFRKLSDFTVLSSSFPCFIAWKTSNFFKFDFERAHIIDDRNKDISFH